MSQTDAKSFLERVAKNEEFLSEPDERACELSTDLPEQLIEAGSRDGLTFTESELAEALAERQNASQVELGETELEAVSGGTDALRMQTVMDRMSRMMSTMSNILKKQKPERYREQHEVSHPQVRDDGEVNNEGVEAAAARH